LSFAYKNNKTAITELLLSLGAIDAKDQPTDKKNKNKKKRLDSDTIEQKTENRIRKYVLIKINDHGDKHVLSSDEIESFKKRYPDVAELLYNQQSLEDLEKNAPEV